MTHCGDVFVVDGTGQWVISEGVIGVDPFVMWEGLVNVNHLRQASIQALF